MGNDSGPRLELQSVVDLLDRHYPQYLAEMRDALPQFSSMLHRGKALGDSEVQDLRLVLELAQKAIPAAREDGEHCLVRLKAQSRKIAQTRFIAGCISAASSAGLLGLLLARSERGAKIAIAVMGLASSVLVLLAETREAYFGGGQALTSLRSTVVDNLVELASIEGELHLLAIDGALADVKGVARRLNVAVSRIRQVELSIL